MAFFFFFIALLAIIAAGAMGFYAFHVRTQLLDCRERSLLLEQSHEQIKQQNSGYHVEKQKWDATYQNLTAAVRRLSKYEAVDDAVSKAAKMKSAAKDELKKANILAEDTLNTAKKDAQAEMSQARSEAKAIRDDIAMTLNSATLEASKIVIAAREQAKATAGGAYEVMEKSELFEKTAKAMKNLIKGYGDEYIIPEASLLDDLSDDFSFDEAGRSLKLAREQTKQMMKNGTAAACDYVEASRRGNAINFVLDAFNGKVDSILSRTKHDNAGKLAQSIRDACTLVNFNGQAFKNARISDLYLDSRLAELKWAEICQQLALKDREEQRHAKEKIREEARALKEQEKALKEAAKEEEMLQKALLQAREEFQHSSGKQRDLYEERLKEMENRLEEAMERKERAKSMAEKTKKGYVYIISNIGSFGEDVFKIGLTRRDNPLDRVRELGDASVPFGFDVHAMILSDDAPALERQLHKHFAFQQINKVNHRKEFFRVSLIEIKAQIETMSLTTGVKWTLASEAREYKESLAIESNPTELKAWEQRQCI